MTDAFAIIWGALAMFAYVALCVRLAMRGKQ